MLVKDATVAGIALIPLCGAGEGVVDGGTTIKPLGVEGLILEGMAMAGELGVIGPPGVAGVDARAGLLKAREEDGLEGGDGEAAAATASIVAEMLSILDTFLTTSVLESAFWFPRFLLGLALGVGGGGGGGVGGLFFFLLPPPPPELDFLLEPPPLFDFPARIINSFIHQTLCFNKNTSTIDAHT